MAELMCAVDGSCCQGGTLDLDCDAPAAVADPKEGETLVDLGAAGIADASADIVISRCVSDLAGDKAALLAGAARVLRPGGRLVVSDVIADPGTDVAAREELAAYIGCIAGTLTRDELAQVLTQAGFADVEITQTHRVHARGGSAIIRARRRP